MVFEKKYADYLTIYKIPLGPDQLDPTVFYYSANTQKHILLPGIYSQIIKDLEFFTERQMYRIKRCYIVGSVVTPTNKNKNGEIRVLIELNKNLGDVDLDGISSERIIQILGGLSNKLAIGTCRKIVYVPFVRPIDENNYSAIYDVIKNQWQKEPDGLNK